MGTCCGADAPLSKMIFQDYTFCHRIYRTFEMIKSNRKYRCLSLTPLDEPAYRPSLTCTQIILSFERL